MIIDFVLKIATILGQKSNHMKQTFANGPDKKMLAKALVSDTRANAEQVSIELSKDKFSLYIYASQRINDDEYDLIGYVRKAYVRSTVGVLAFKRTVWGESSRMPRGQVKLRINTRTRQGTIEYNW